MSALDSVMQPRTSSGGQWRGRWFTARDQWT